MSHKIEKEWVTKSGLKAAVLFIHGSHNCGYVIVDKDHPLYEISYQDIPNFEVHGGVTFSGNISDIAPEHKLWAIGFDAAHSGDKTLGIGYPGDTFKDVDYMTKECENLAKQIIKEIK